MEYNLLRRNYSGPCISPTVIALASSPTKPTIFPNIFSKAASSFEDFEDFGIGEENLNRRVNPRLIFEKREREKERERLSARFSWGTNHR